MLLRISINTVLCIGVAACSTPQGQLERTAEGDDTPPASGKAGHGTFESRLGYYDNSDSPTDGNPFLDESLTVVEPVFYLSYNTTNEHTWWGKFSYDRVSSASIKRLNDYPGSQQSGASGDNYFGLDVGRKFKAPDGGGNDLSVHASAEYDYRSLGASGGYSWDSADHNQTTKISTNVFYDDLDLILFNGTEGGGDKRISVSVGWQRYQVVSKQTHAEFGSTFTFQNGFLGTPYNAVVLEDPTLAPNPLLFNNARGVEISERLPDSRLRLAIHGRVRRSLTNSTALEVGGRIYGDDWGLTSLTVEPRLYQWLIVDRLRSRLRYRFYTQTAVDDYQESFTQADRNREFLTQDSDLGDIDSHTIGAGLTWTYSPETEFQLAADYVLRSDGIDQVFGSISMSRSF